jgi:lysophospholipase L1-like esterase
MNHPEYFPDSVHPNAVGNKAIAETVFTALNKL